MSIFPRTLPFLLLFLPGLLAAAPDLSGKRVLYINSYHSGYEWRMAFVRRLRK